MFSASLFSGQSPVNFGKRQDLQRYSVEIYNKYYFSFNQ